MKVKTWFIACGLAVCLFSQTAVAGQWDDVKAAYGRGDYETALKLLRQLADHGDAAAQKTLGYMYVFGQGVPQSYVEAVKWVRKAADQGDAEAQGLLGVSYRDGRGVPQDDAEAMKWLNKAADQGDASAQRQLGGMYESGISTPQDLVQAHKWFYLAEDANAIIRVAKRLTPEQLAEARRLAQEWLAANPKK